MATMGSSEYLFILSAIIVLNSVWFDLTQALPRDEDIDKKYIPFEEALLLLKYLRNDDSSENSWFINPLGNISAVLEGTVVSPLQKNLWSTEYEDANEKVKLFVHTRQEPEGVEYKIQNLTEIEFNPSYPTKILCHGWLADGRGKMVKIITEAYLADGDYNLIAVDWSSYSSDWIYPNSVLATSHIGKFVADVIDTLVETRKARYSDFHIIGHSLGAHVAGFAGNQTKGRIGRITGLDPALPGFQYIQGPEGRLDETDANFVDVIHTCSGVLGMSVPIGHVDFFPNGGTPLQPGCMSLIPNEIKSCSHGRSQEFFAESISNKTAFTGIECEDWNHFTNHTCEDIYAIMGEHASKDIRGVFYLRTKDHPPFGQGKEGTIY